MTFKQLLVDKSFYKENIVLATPIVLANAGQSLVSVVDNAMVGRLGPNPRCSGFRRRIGNERIGVRFGDSRTV